MTFRETINTGWLCRFFIILVCVQQHNVYAAIDDILAMEDDYAEIIESDGLVGKTGPSLRTLVRKGKTYVRHELDMLIPRDTFRTLYSMSETGNRKKRNAVKEEKQLWKFNRIPYTIDPLFNSNERLVIMEAIEQWSLSTCVRFVPAPPTEYNVLAFKHYDKGMCSSHLGMVQGEQDIKLPPRCRDRVTVMHEIGHTLGLYHEHSRAVRDSYVTILWQNILAGDNREAQFDKLRPSSYSNYSKPYDYESLMHYGKYYFSKNKSAGLETMVAVNTEHADIMGNVDHISFLDAMIVSKMYQCSAKCKPKLCPDEGFLGRECECWCPGTALEPVVRCRREAKCNGAPPVDLSPYDIFTPSFVQIFNTDRKFPSGTILHLAFRDNDICGDNVAEYVCLHGVWNGTLPTCSPPACYIPEYMHETYDIVSSQSGTNVSVVEHDEQIILTCNEGPEIIPFQLTCKYGNFTGERTECIIGNCSLSELDHKKYSYTDMDTGNILSLDDVVPGLTQVTASCMLQFEEQNITCSILGEWMEIPDFCEERKPCTIIPNANMTGSYYSGYDITCMAGYNMNRRDLFSIFKCTWEGTWYPFMPECVESDCFMDPEINDPLNEFRNKEGHVLSENSRVKHGETVVLGCPRRRRQNVRCNKGAWETQGGSTPTCMRPRRGFSIA